MVKIRKCMIKSPVFSLNAELLSELLAGHADERHFRVHTCAALRVPSQWRIAPRLISDFHLLYVRGGRGVYTLNGQTVPLRDAMVVFLTNGVTYSATQDYGNPPDIIPVRFCAYENHSGEMVNWGGAPIALALQAGNPARFADHFQYLHRAWSSAVAGTPSSACSAFLHVILQELLQESRRAELTTRPAARLRRVHDYIVNHPHDRSDLRQLAERAGFSQKYFSKLFKDCFGLAPKHLQLQTRLHHARYLLENTEAGVADVAQSLDYTDAFVFSRQFKSMFGIAPSRIQVRVPDGTRPVDRKNAGAERINK
jgi:AraC-like DNA-binding protein